SMCGAIHADLKLADRHWRCESCGTKHDRDINAAKNIRREGLRLLAEGTGPEGRTRRSRGTEAREEDACATGGTSSIGQPTSLNCELAYRAAKPRTTRQRRDRPGLRVEG
ncbi:protein containing Transposase, IS605 OrfB, partial [mine drainage metagenome]